MIHDIIYSKVLGLHIEIEYNTALRSISFLKHGENHKEKKTLDASFELERYFEGEVIEFSSDLDILKVIGICLFKFKQSGFDINPCRVPADTLF